MVPSFLFSILRGPLDTSSSFSSSSFFSHDPSTARSNVGMKSERRPETGPDSPHHLCILACISRPPPPLPLSPKLLSRLLYYLLFFHGSARYIHVSSTKRRYFARLLSVSRLSFYLSAW